MHSPCGTKAWNCSLDPWSAFYYYLWSYFFYHFSFLVVLKPHWPACYSWTTWTPSCPRTFACALFYFFLKSSWLEFLTFVHISDEMWERMSQITLFRIKPIPVPSSPPPCLLYFSLKHLTRHFLFPLEHKLLERMLYFVPCYVYSA